MQQPGLTRTRLSTYVAYMDLRTVAATAADTTSPAEGLRAVAALRRLADSLELAQVESALHAGMGWSDIAAALGVTRQAVHKKYAKRVSPSLLPTRAGRAARANHDPRSAHEHGRTP